MKEEIILVVRRGKRRARDCCGKEIEGYLSVWF
jgi:hypothetical protein